MNGILLDPLEDGKTPADLNYIWHDLVDGHRDKQLEQFWSLRLEEER